MAFARSTKLQAPQRVLRFGKSDEQSAEMFAAAVGLLAAAVVSLIGVQMSPTTFRPRLVNASESFLELKSKTLSKSKTLPSCVFVNGVRSLDFA